MPANTQHTQYIEARTLCPAFNVWTKMSNAFSWMEIIDFGPKVKKKKKKQTGAERRWVGWVQRFKVIAG